MDDVSCSSDEWESCTFSKDNNCYHGEDVFLRCLHGEKHPITALVSTTGRKHPCLPGVLPPGGEGERPPPTPLNRKRRFLFNRNLFIEMDSTSVEKLPALLHMIV